MGWGNPFKKARKQLKRTTRSVEKAVSKAASSTTKAVSTATSQVGKQSRELGRQIAQPYEQTGREAARLAGGVDWERTALDYATGGLYEVTREVASQLEEPWRELTGQAAMDAYLDALESQETIQFLGTGFEEEEEEEEISFGSGSSIDGGDGRESVIRKETSVDTGLSVSSAGGVGI